MSKMFIKPRARDLGLPFDGETGEFNAITDVAGVEVGFTTLIEGEGAVEVGRGPIRTGVTAILPRGKRKMPSPIWAGQFNLNGNGEMTGTHWINEAGYFISPICITNTHSVGIAHHGTVGWMIDHYFDDIYRAIVQGVEEAVVNAMIAAESMTTVKPGGYTLKSIDHSRLQQIMGQYNRLL